MNSKKIKKGRQGPILSGYWPAFKFVGPTTMISGKIDLIDGRPILQGMKGAVQITFIRGMIPDSCFKIGTIFEYSEGGAVHLGEGKFWKY